MSCSWPIKCQPLKGEIDFSFTTCATCLILSFSEEESTLPFFRISMTILYMDSNLAKKLQFNGIFEFFYCISESPKEH
jgi:hypothetical protein